MPVVINEFEIMADEAPAPQPAAAHEPAADDAPPLEPPQMLCLLQQLEARALRTWAH